jgi:hypothetical protein
MDPGAGDGHPEAFAVSRPVLSPFRRRIGFLEDPGVHRISGKRQGANRLPDLVIEFVAQTQRREGLSESGYGNRKDYADDEYRAQFCIW